MSLYRYMSISIDICIHLMGNLWKQAIGPLRGQTHHWRRLTTPPTTSRPVPPLPPPPSSFFLCDYTFSGSEVITGSLEE